MEITYANKRIEKCFSNYDLLTKKVGFELTRQVKKTVGWLEAAETFGDFLKTGLGHPEQLKGYKQIRYSIRVSKNARLIVEPNTEQDALLICSEIEVEGVCDYHGGKENWYIS